MPRKPGMTLAGEKRLSQRNHLLLAKQRYHGLEQEPDDSPRSKAVLALCDILLDNYTENERGTKKKPEPQGGELIQAYRDSIIQAADAVRDTFKIYQSRHDVAVLLGVAGTKVSQLRKRLKGTPKVAETVPEAVVAPATEAPLPRNYPMPSLGEDDEWGAKQLRSHPTYQPQAST